MQKKLTILLVIETGGGGSARHVFDLIHQLVRKQHKVHLIYSARRMDQGFSNELQKLNDVRTRQIDMRRSPHPGDIHAVRQIRAYIDQQGPFDIIHGHSSKGGALARIAAIGKAGATVYTPHAFRTLDTDLKPLSRRVYSSIEFLLAYITDAFILVSDEEKAHASSFGLPARKLSVVENGLAPLSPLPRETVRQRWGIRDEICIGFVGRLAAQKNPRALIEAFALLRTSDLPLKLVILGGGELKVELETLANKHEITNKIIWVTGNDGPAIMSGFDVFAMPSLYEAFPYVLLEAAAAGLPIIATPVGGTMALVKEHVNGYLIEQNRPDRLAEAIQALGASQELRSRMGAASRAIAADYSVETMADKTCAVYRRLLTTENRLAQA